MKSIKLILLLICFFTIIPSLSAQKLGVRAGWNSATVSGTDFGDVSSRDGFYLGVFKEITLVPKLLFFQPELQYSSQGFKSNGNDYAINYINVPLLAKVYFLKILSFEAGPQFGFKIDDNIDGANSIETFDAAIDAGVGINLPLGFSIDARYVQGLSEIVKDSVSKNQVVQVGAAFKF